jgi:hypothetical protein
MSKPRPPCQHCPFRARYKGENDYLRPGRRLEIVQSVINGAEFPCHETVVHNEDGEYEPSRGEQACVGVDILMLREGMSGQMMRIRERLGVLDPERLLQQSKRMKMWNWDDVKRDAHGDTEAEGDVCSVSGQDCEAPAGWLIDGNVVDGGVITENVCDECDEHVCESCMTDESHECWRFAIEDAEVISDTNWFPPPDSVPRALPRTTQSAFDFTAPPPDSPEYRKQKVGPPSDTLTVPTTQKGK